MQPCSHAAMQPCSHAALQPCSPAALQPCSPAALQPCSPAAMQPCSPAAANEYLWVAVCGSQRYHQLEVLRNSRALLPQFSATQWREEELGQVLLKGSNLYELPFMRNCLATQLQKYIVSV